MKTESQTITNLLMPTESVGLGLSDDIVGTEALLSVRHVSRQFPGVQALSNMSLDVFAGEVHVLFGENGAGKSTLMNIISGALAPSSGQLYMHGDPIVFQSVQDARHAGICGDDVFTVAAFGRSRRRRNAAPRGGASAGDPQDRP